MREIKVVRGTPDTIGKSGYLHGFFPGVTNRDSKGIVAVIEIDRVIYVVDAVDIMFEYDSL